MVERAVATFGRLDTAFDKPGSGGSQGNQLVVEVEHGGGAHGTESPGRAAGPEPGMGHEDLGLTNPAPD